MLVDPVTFTVHFVIHIASDYAKDGLNHVINHLREGGEPINHDLQKALKCCVICATQKITMECAREMVAESPFLAPKSPDFQWLEQNIHRLEVELGQVDQATFDTDTTFDTLNKVTTLLDSPEQITTGRKELNQQLIKDALSVRPVPACYEDKVTDAQKGIFVRVCDYFADEVKRNSKVRRIFDSQTIARIYSQISIFYGILMEIRLKVDLTLQKLVKIEEMLEKQSVMLQSIKAGSVVLVVAGSAQAIQRLQVLFHSGELSKLLDVPVAAVELITSPSLPVRLSQWFQNLKEATEAGWLTLQELAMEPLFCFPFTCLQK